MGRLPLAAVTSVSLLLAVSFLPGIAIVEAAYIDAAGCCRHGLAPFQLDLAPNLGIACDPEIVPLDFEGQTCQIVVNQGVAPDGHSIADLEITEFAMTSVHPVFGELVISLDTSRPVVSTLRSVNPGADFPVIHTTRIHVIATAGSMPGVVLRNQGPPLEFIGDPSDSWPPTNNVYTLPVPVNFEDRENPGPILLTACPGSVVVAGRIVEGNGIVDVPALSSRGVVLMVLVLLLCVALTLWRRRLG